LFLLYVWNKIFWAEQNLGRSTAPECPPPGLPDCLLVLCLTFPRRCRSNRGRSRPFPTNQHKQRWVGWSSGFRFWTEQSAFSRPTPANHRAVLLRVAPYQCPHFQQTYNCVWGDNSKLGNLLYYRDRNDCGEWKKVPTMSQVLSSIQHIASERPQVRTYGRQTSVLPQEPSNLVMPLIGMYTSNHCATRSWVTVRDLFQMKRMAQCFSF